MGNRFNLITTTLNLIKQVIYMIFNGSANSRFTSWVFIIGTFSMCRYLYGRPNGAFWEFAKVPEIDFFAFVFIAWLYCQLTASDAKNANFSKDSFWVFILIEFFISLGINPLWK